MSPPHVPGLRHVDDTAPGIRRVRRGRGFGYVGPGGDPIRDGDEIARIKRIAIPPAWTDVWICPLANGHIQATGRDARGRKQYRYHERWRQVRDATKYDRLVDFAAALRRVRAHVAADLARPGLSRERVLATVVRLLDITRIRVGNDEYARANGSFGLTTMRARHVQVRGSELTFEFLGKSRRVHRVTVRDPRIARIVKRCQEIPGQDLFQYVDDDGTRHSISSDAVNDYIRNAAGGDFTAKDFRTWSGTVLAFRALQQSAAADGGVPPRHAVNGAIAEVAAALGNTVAVCRRCYIHPAVLEAHLDGALPRHPEGDDAGDPAADATDLSAAERAVLSLLRRRLREAA